MRRLVLLVAAVLVLHGTWRVGSAYWQHYRLEDDVREMVQFSEDASVEALTRGVLDLAALHAIPLDPQDVTVIKQARSVTVDGAYVREVEILPGYPRPWDFTLHIVVLTL